MVRIKVLRKIRAITQILIKYNFRRIRINNE